VTAAVTRYVRVRSIELLVIPLLSFCAPRDLRLTDDGLRFDEQMDERKKKKY